MSLMVMTLVAPGSAQLLAGNRRVGLIALRIWVGLLAVGLVGLVAVLLDRGLIFQVAFDATLLLFLRIGLLVGAVAWAALFVDAWRLGQPLSYGLAHRRADGRCQRPALLRGGRHHAVRRAPGRRAARPGDRAVRRR